MDLFSTGFSIASSKPPSAVNEGLVNNQTLAVALAEQAGYNVGMFGKTLNTVPMAPYRGVTGWLVNGGGSYEDPSFAVSNIKGLPEGVVTFNASNTERLGLKGSSYSTSVIGNYSVQWIADALSGTKPLMAYIGTKAPQ